MNLASYRAQTYSCSRTLYAPAFRTVLDKVTLHDVESLADTRVWHHLCPCEPLHTVAYEPEPRAATATAAQVDAQRKQEERSKAVQRLSAALPAALADMTRDELLELVPDDIRAYAEDALQQLDQS